MIHQYHPFTITLRSPAILNLPGGDPSSAATMQYVPGSALRGALARALGDPGADSPRLDEFRTLVLGGSVRFLNAYPVDGQQRALPTLVSLNVPKGETGAVAHTVIDLSAWVAPEDGWPNESLESARFSYVSLTAAQPRAVDVALGSRIHQQRDRARGRAWTEKKDDREIAHGAIFAYEYLEAGQQFGGLLQVSGHDKEECDRLRQRVKALLDSRALLLGRSRRSGYGGEVALAWGSAREREVSGEGVLGSNIPVDKVFRVLLVSPCIVRDPRTGQLDPSALELALVERLEQRAKVVCKRWAFSLAGGFNRKWRLEVPQAPAVAAGSVLVLRATADIPLDDFLHIENEGLGERLTEGFGRLCFLEPAPERARVERNQARPPQRPAGEPPELVRFIEKRVLQAAMNRAIDERAAEIARDARGLPSPSLLGRLRVPLREESAAARETHGVWFGEDAEALRRPAREQMDRCRIRMNGHAIVLRAWIQRLIGDEGQTWNELKHSLPVEALAVRHHMMSTDAALEAIEAQSARFAVRLLDAVLAAMIRRKKREQGA